jgi:hypothetical protein
MSNEIGGCVEDPRTIQMHPHQVIVSGFGQSPHFLGQYRHAPTHVVGIFDADQAGRHGRGRGRRVLHLLRFQDPELAFERMGHDTGGMGVG